MSSFTAGLPVLPARPAWFPTLPGGWSRARLGHVASVSARIGWKALTADEYVPAGYAFLSTPNIKGDEIDFSDVNYISEFRYQESPELQLATGDVLLVKDGNTLGIVNRVGHLPRPATVNGSIAVIRPVGIESRYLAYLLESKVIQGLIEALKSGMGVPHLFQFDLNRFPVPLPPEMEQREIADYLDRETAGIDALISAKQRMTALLVEQRQAWLSAAVATVGADGGNTKLKYVARIQGGVTLGKTYDDAQVREWPYLRVANVQAYEVDLTDVATIRLPLAVAKRHRLMPGDLLLAEGNGNPDNLGRAVVWNGAIEDCLHQNHVFALRPDAAIRPRFLEAVLATDRSRRHFREGASQVGIASISQEKVLSLSLPVPSMSIQDAFVERLSDYDRPATNVRRHLATQTGLLVERRQALITAAVTGQIQVSVAA